MPRPHFAIVRSLGDSAGVDSSISIPAGLVDLRGGVRSADLAARPPREVEGLRSGLSASQRAGLRYEARVGRAIADLARAHSLEYFPGPWIQFTKPGSDRLFWCQPDILLMRPGLVYICEVKASHVINAYWQLTAKYEPVVRRLFPDRDVLLVEIARGGDALAPWPMPINLISDVLDAKIGAYNLMLGYAK